MRSIEDNITEEVVLDEIQEIISLPMYADRINSDSRAHGRRRWILHCCGLWRTSLSLSLQTLRCFPFTHSPWNGQTGHKNCHISRIRSHIFPPIFIIILLCCLMGYTALSEQNLVEPAMYLAHYLHVNKFIISFFLSLFWSFYLILAKNSIGEQGP